MAAPVTHTCNDSRTQERNNGAPSREEVEGKRSAATITRQGGFTCSIHSVGAAAMPVTHTRQLQPPTPSLPLTNHTPAHPSSHPPSLPHTHTPHPSAPFLPPPSLPPTLTHERADGVGGREEVEGGQHGYDRQKLGGGGGREKGGG